MLQMCAGRQVHNKYTAEDFDEDLRTVLRRSGCKGEKICFILDESNMLDSSFLERMNTLLANGEVPGLFEGETRAQPLTAPFHWGCLSGLLIHLLQTPLSRVLFWFIYGWFTPNALFISSSLVHMLSPIFEFQCY